jgi:hypothetical protein
VVIDVCGSGGDTNFRYDPQFGEIRNKHVLLTRLILSNVLSNLWFMPWYSVAMTTVFKNITLVTNQSNMGFMISAAHRRRISLTGLRRRSVACGIITQTDEV